MSKLKVYGLSKRARNGSIHRLWTVARLMERSRTYAPSVSNHAYEQWYFLKWEDAMDHANRLARQNTEDKQ